MDDTLFTRALGAYNDRQQAQKDALEQKKKKEAHKEEIMADLQQKINDGLTVVDDVTKAADLKEVVDEEELKALQKKVNKRPFWKRGKDRQTEEEPEEETDTGETVETVSGSDLNVPDTDDDGFSFQM